MKKDSGVKCGRPPGTLKCEPALAKRLFDEGKSIREICEELRIADPTARKLLKLSGVTPPTIKRAFRCSALTAQSLFSEGLTVDQICRHMGFSPSAVRCALRRAGVKLKGPPRGGWGPR